MKNADAMPATTESEALRRHRAARGKIEIQPKCSIRSPADLAVWYTPGVAEACRAITADPGAVYEVTNKGNLVAVVSDGTRVLGLGDIGPEAGLPVMEGKCLLFKYLAGVDAMPICLGTKRADDIVRAVEWLAPSFGAVNLEDIAQPKCFRVLDALRASLRIPVWHDDQQGTATVVLAGLIAALTLTGRNFAHARMAMIGMGAANVATYRLLKAYGANPGNIVACDSKGILHRGRVDIEREQSLFLEKWEICRESNGAQRIGGIDAALAGADVCLAFSRPGPGVIRPEWIAAMRPKAIVFAGANPVPEISPAEARDAGAAVIATGRSDFPNQVNNALAFPGMFRGVLDVRARAITDGMAIAAARALAEYGAELGVHAGRILPAINDREAVARVAVAVGMEAQRQGIAALARAASELRNLALAAIDRARKANAALFACRAAAAP